MKRFRYTIRITGTTTVLADDPDEALDKGLSEVSGWDTHHLEIDGFEPNIPELDPYEQSL